MQISNVKYPPPGSGGHPQAMLLIMLNNPLTVCPTLQFSYIAGGVADGSATVRLPIFMNRFMEPVDMPLPKFRSVWDDITTKRPDSFQKMDVIMKNPAPPNVSHMDLLRKMANLLTNCFNMKVIPPENT